MGNTEFAFLLLTVAGLMNACFTLPMKFTRRWAWENTWLVFSFFSLVMLPAVVALVTVPELGAVYSASGIAEIVHVMIFGAGWGLSQVFFGIAVETIGIALTFSLVLGTSAAMGALIPLLRLNPEKLYTAAGRILMLGIATVLLGVAICAVAGRMRELAKSVIAGKQRGNGTAGLILAIVCGCLASCINLGFAFGSLVEKLAIHHGASSSSAANAVWLPLLAAGAVPNMLYCGGQLFKNTSGGNFMRSGLDHWMLALAMAVFWFGSVLLYGISVLQLGPLGAVVGWPLFMSLIVIAASLLGIVTGEWKGSGRWPLAIQLTGVTVLVLAIFILARTSQTLA